MTKILIAAITIDGKIAKNAYHNVNWTSKADKQFFRNQTRQAGVVIFGSNTFKAMGGPMPNCLNVVMTREPDKYRQMYKCHCEKGVKRLTKQSLQSKSKIASSSNDILEFTSDSPKIILDSLTKKGYTKVIIGGGSAIYSLFLEHRLIDEIYLTITPKIFGKGINLFKDMDIDEVNLELLSVEKLGKGEVLLKYKVS